MPYRDAEDRRRFDRERRRRERAEQGRPVAIAAPVRLRVAADVEAVLGEAVELVRADPKARGTEKARALAYVASVALRLIEAHDLTARLEVLEHVLELRSTG